MENRPIFDSIQPRNLKYRDHYKLYLVALMCLAGLLLVFWGHQLSYNSIEAVYIAYKVEIWVSGLFYASAGVFYFFWLKDRLDQSVRVYPTHLLLQKGKETIEVRFEDLESVGAVLGSVFYLKTKSGLKYFFNSALERADYIWEGVHKVRPDLFNQDEFESFRLKLVQNDHHQMRKEWFLKHRIVDVLNWFVFPLFFISAAYFIQSREVIINHQGLYFFRLFMYAILTLVVTSFIFSFVLKKFIFDKRIEEKMSSAPMAKQRDIDFEESILQYSKFMQMVSSVFIFAVLLKMNTNLFSVTKLKVDVVGLGLNKGQTVVVDNRFNCIECRFSVTEGDVVIFGKGIIGEVIAKSGDMIGRVHEEKKGRTIASDYIQEVPAGYLAIRTLGNSETILVKLSDLIGKVKK